MNIVTTEKIVSFKGDLSKTLFYQNQTADLRCANKAMHADFAGCNYDPNFDAGVDGFAQYLEEFTGSHWNDFDDNQIDLIKEIFNL